MCQKEWLHQNGDRTSQHELYVAFEKFHPDKDYKTLCEWIFSEDLDGLKISTRCWEEIAQHLEDNGFQFEPCPFGGLPEKHLSIRLRIVQYFMAVEQCRREAWGEL